MRASCSSIMQAVKRCKLFCDEIAPIRRGPKFRFVHEEARFPLDREESIGPVPASDKVVGLSDTLEVAGSSLTVPAIHCESFGALANPLAPRESSDFPQPARGSTAEVL
jgi:hypothetical protein